MSATEQEKEQGTIESTSPNLMISIGKQLKEAREKKNWTLEHVAEITRINMGILINIEEGNFLDSPGPVFIKGFIKTYANLVGIYNDSFKETINKISELKESKIGEIHTAIEEPQTKSKKIVFIILLIILAGLTLFYYKWGEQFFTQNDSKKIVESEITKEIDEEGNTSKNAKDVVIEEDLREEAKNIEIPIPDEVLEELEPPKEPVDPEIEINHDQPEVEINREAQINQLIEDKPLDQASNEKPPEPKPESPEPKPEQPLEQEIPVTPEITSDSPVTDKLFLTILGLEKTWINVVIDDNTPVDVLVNPNDQIKWQGDNQFRLTIGNTKGVSFKLNEVDLSFNQTHDLLEKWIVNKDTLKTLNQ